MIRIFYPCKVPKTVPQNQFLSFYSKFHLILFFDAKKKKISVFAKFCNSENFFNSLNVEIWIIFVSFFFSRQSRSSSVSSTKSALKPPISLVKDIPDIGRMTIDVHQYRTLVQDVVETKTQLFKLKRLLEEVSFIEGLFFYLIRVKI